MKNEAVGLSPGDLVRVRVTSHQPWGVTTRVVGHEGTGSSVDAVRIDSPEGGRADDPYFPEVGAELTAVVFRVGTEQRPWVHLSLRRAHLENPTNLIERSPASELLKERGQTLRGQYARRRESWRHLA
ncbi:hypothetical protein [Nocardiopsis halotolerans]|uniref:hypothetical protein n=1 Tax=Nocardiopsis halotolerans TaxID=124252 RepID=UPI00037FF37A|nr:hypothetical protein [Nocardiopsis halotolerans]